MKRERVKEEVVVEEENREDAEKEDQEEEETHAKGHLNVSRNGDEAEQDFMVVYKCVFYTHICNDGHDAGDIGVAHTQNMRVVAVDRST